MTASTSSELELLALELEGLKPQYDMVEAEILDIVTTKRRDVRVQTLPKLRIRSLRDVILFARQVAAIANGAIVMNASFGILILPKCELQIRSNIYDTSSDDLNIDVKLNEGRDKVANILIDLLSPYIGPNIQLSLHHISHKDCYFKVTNLVSIPVSFRENESSSWEIPIWSNTKDGHWRVGVIESSDGVKLFSCYFQVAIRELNLEAPKDNNKKLPSEVRLQDWQIRTANDFLAFLLTELLDSNVDTRTLAATTLSKLETLNAKCFPQLSKLLLGLIEDEVEIAERVIRLLGKLGNQQTYHFLLRNYEVYPDVELKKAFIECMGEMAPVGGKQHLITLWQSNPDEILQPAFDDALTRYFERNNIPRFDVQIREQFKSAVFQGEANYKVAIEFLLAKRSAICLSYPHFTKLVCLLEFANLIQERNVFDALEKLRIHRSFDKKHLAGSTEDEDDKVDKNVSDMLEEKIKIVEELITWDSEQEQLTIISLWVLERLAERHNADGFTIEVSRIVEPFFLYSLEKHGVEINPNLGVFKTFSRKWADQHEDLLSSIDLNKNASLTAANSRKLLKKIVVNQERNVISDDDSTRIEGLIEHIAALARTRNSLSHDGNYLSIEDFEQMFGDIQESFENIKELFCFLTRKDWIRNPVRNIPADVISMLDREPLFPVSMQMFE